MINTITDPEVRPPALARVAVALIRAHRHEEAAAIAEQAEAAARSITTPGGQALSLAQVARALGSAGQHHQAAGLARQAESLTRSLAGPPLGQVPARASVAGALAETGQYQQAEAIARSIADHQPSRDLALSWVVNALAGAGQCGQAEMLARAITRPDRRAEALARIAETLAESGESPSARRLAAEACAVGSWMVTVTTVLLLDPSASTEVIRLLADAQHVPSARKIADGNSPRLL
jgi:hypothetical protein